VAWQVFASVVGPYYFPDLGSIAVGFVEVVHAGGVQLVLDSFRQMLLGFGLAVAIGVPLGLLIGSSWVLDFLLRPYVNVLFVTSLSAVIPLIILFFGTGFQFRVAVVFLFAVFYVIITPANGVRAIESGIVDMGRSFGAGPWKRFVAITMPGTMPFIVSGMRLGLGQAVQGMIIAELWVTVGSGQRLENLSQNRELGQFFAMAAIIVLVGTVLGQLVLWVQRRISPWAGDAAAAIEGGS